MDLYASDVVRVVRGDGVGWAIGCLVSGHQRTSVSVVAMPRVMLPVLVRIRLDITLPQTLGPARVSACGTTQG